jgi:hypothetical protein
MHWRLVFSGCNLYSITSNQIASLALFRVIKRGRRRREGSRALVAGNAQQSVSVTLFSWHSAALTLHGEARSRS